MRDDSIALKELSPLPKYVLITPARNEASFIELTIRSVIRQTVLPLKWVIVSDGSTDGTDDIVAKYATEHDWIDFVSMPERKDRHFAGKVLAFNAGYQKIKSLEYEIIGNLDADISFEEDYLSFLLRKFAENPELGVVGTPFKDGDSVYDYRFTSVEHVSGACQLFRRECFESIGGYTPLKAGGVDLAAVLTARMMGWKTRTFTEKICIHHRKMGSASCRVLMGTFRGGYHDYLMGSCPTWQVVRSVYQMSKKPLIIGGSFLLAGYVWGMVTRAERLVSRELAEFRKREQMRRLSHFIRKSFAIGCFKDKPTITV